MYCLLYRYSGSYEFKINRLPRQFLSINRSPPSDRLPPCPPMLWRRLNLCFILTYLNLLLNTSRPFFKVQILAFWVAGAKQRRIEECGSATSPWQTRILRYSFYFVQTYSGCFFKFVKRLWTCPGNQLRQVNLIWCILIFSIYRAWIWDWCVRSSILPKISRF